jgi:hypothetical protein
MWVTCCDSTGRRVARWDEMEESPLRTDRRYAVALIGLLHHCPYTATTVDPPGRASRTLACSVIRVGPGMH